MSIARVVSLNVGLARDEEWAGELKRTAIDKRPVTGPVRVNAFGLAGDEVADTENHGGRDQAVYAFAQEDIDQWASLLGRPIRPGLFGENLTTTGIDVNEAVVGECWRVGSVLLQVCAVRIPCVVFQNWLGLHGHDNRRWVKRFTVDARPGPYLRVLEEGVLRAGDELVVESRPSHAVTVSMMFRALTTERDLLPLLQAVDALPERERCEVERYVASQRISPQHG